MKRLAILVAVYCAGVATILYLDAREALKHRPSKMGRLAQPRALR